MDMAVDNPPDITVWGQHPGQPIGILQNRAIHPRAVDRNKVVVQSQQRVLIRVLLQASSEHLQLGIIKIAVRLTFHPGVQQQDLPVPQHKLSLQCRRIDSSHQLGLIVITCQPVTGYTKGRQQSVQAVIRVLCFILTQVTGNQQAGCVLVIALNNGQNTLQGRGSVNIFMPGAGVSQQMGVRNLQHFNCLHGASFEPVILFFRYRHDKQAKRNPAIEPETDYAAPSHRADTF